MSTLETISPHSLPAPLTALRLEQAPLVTLRAGGAEGVAALGEPQSVAGEQYRRLAIALQTLRSRRPLRRILITSAAPSEGKSLTAANLAVTLARPGGCRVLLVEGDLHRPSLLRRLNASHDSGLSDWLEQRRELSECLARWPDLPLWVLPAARPTRLPLELLQAIPPSAILDPLEPAFDWIVVDSPPLLAMADACHWASACDGVMMVVRRYRTRLRDLLPAAAQIERSKWLGVLFNESSLPCHDYYRSYYHP